MQDSQDIENRKPIWSALSEFYLDTELSREDFDRIAAIFKDSRLSLSEIKQIDLIEVFPLLQANLLSAAGDWAGFDEAWLSLECSKRYHRRKSTFHRLKCKFWNVFFYWMRRDCWKQIEKRLGTA